MTKKASSSLFEAISRISYFAYKPTIAKYPFIKEYLKKEKNPRTAWSLWMTAAGAAYVLLTKEAYLGEHNEITEAVEKVESLNNFVKDCANFMLDVYKKNRKFYPHAIGFWVITRIKGEKPTLEELEGLPQDIAKLLNSTIQDYEAKKQKK